MTLVVVSIVLLLPPSLAQFAESDLSVAAVFVVVVVSVAGSPAV